MKLLDHLFNNQQRVLPSCLAPATFALVLLVCMALLTTPVLAAKATSPKNIEALEVNTMIGDPSIENCSGNIANPSKLTLPLGKSTLINLPEPLASRSVGNKKVVDVRMVSPKTMYVVGVYVGSTNMIIQGKSGTCTIVDVIVTLDPDPLKQDFNALFPYEKNVEVRAANDSLILSGTVEDAITANRMVDVARAYVRRKVNENQVTGDAQSQRIQDDRDAELGQYDTRVNMRVINMLSVSAQQQVMLEVKVAEVSKTLLDQLGASLSLSQTSGSWSYRILSDFLSTTGSATGGLLGGIKSTSKNFAIDGQKDDGLIKILAEPSIMAISGQEGSFLAGGTIFIPVAQNNAGNGTLITLEEKEFGVGVKFTPTVLAGGRINLKVAPEVSELNREGVGISATGFAGTAIFPAFSTRKASTTVQLMDGQSFAIGGLIKNNTTTNIKAFPVLGEIPILGALFRSTEFQKDKTELIFVVTPHLVKPLAPQDVRLPTDRYTEPSRSDLFLKGKMEGPAPTDVPPAPEANKTMPPLVKPNEPAQNDGAGFDVR